MRKVIFPGLVSRLNLNETSDFRGDTMKLFLLLVDDEPEVLKQLIETLGIGCLHAVGPYMDRIAAASWIPVVRACS